MVCIPDILLREDYSVRRFEPQCYTFNGVISSGHILYCVCTLPIRRSARGNNAVWVGICAETHKMKPLAVERISEKFGNTLSPVLEMDL